MLMNGILKEAEEFICACYRELHKTEQERENRLNHIQN